MKVRKIICFIICIGCILCVCLRIESFSLSAKSSLAGADGNQLAIESVDNNSYQAKTKLLIGFSIMQENVNSIRVYNDHVKQCYEVNIELKKKQVIEEKKLRDQFPVQTLQELKVMKRDSKGLNIQIQMKMSSVYELSYSWKDAGLVVELTPPHLKYKKIVLLDAGHGGSDCGALSQDKRNDEKSVNLAVAKHLGQYLEKQNIKVYYTRTSDTKVTLEQRVAMANKIGPDLFLSIHCNSAKQEQPNGSAAFYAEQTGHNISDSKRFADVLLKGTENVLKRKNLGVYSGQKYYIVGRAVVPTVLLEMAFISNNSDVLYLINDNYQKDLAKELGNKVVKALY